MTPKKLKPAKRKTTAKTTAVAKVPQPNGGALNTGGTPGNKGGTGRPPDAFKSALQELAGGDATLAHVRTILSDPSHTQFMAALRWATEHGYGKATETVELTGKDGGPIQTEAFEWAGITLKLA